jgi:preprotein translocase subunit SecD
MGIMFISPSLQWYFQIPEETKNIALGSLPQIKNYAQGEAQKEYDAVVSFVQKAPSSSKLSQNFAQFMKNLYAPLSPEDFQAVVEGYSRDDILNVKNLRDLTLQLGLDLQGGLYVSIKADFESLQKQMAEKNKDNPQAGAEIDKNKILQDVMERLNNRIDQFGVVEPIIRRQLGSDSIIVELPGAADPERIQKVILGKGRLNFHMVDSESENNFTNYVKTHPKYKPAFDSEGKVIVPEGLAIDAGTIILGSYRKDKYGMDELVNYIAIKEDPILSGEAVQDAKAEMNVQDRSAEVTFILGDFLDRDGIMKNGPNLFSDLTEKNKGKYLSVVLDNKVMSAAQINDKIPNGQVRVTGGFTYKDADDLAKVLRTGALPVPLDITNTSKVGASLGEDTISKGLNALFIGAILVVGFMFVYYKGAGFFANVALVFNMFLLLSVLSVARFTLSLTSMAGIVLTIGMAVDANVIIYERMKEEFRQGKTVKAAIKAGFDRAFWTILDSNVTTFIAGMVLALFTKGSIQGFAFTLCAGIITSFFSALFVSRILFDFTTDVLKSTKLSISWRRLQ